LNYDAIIRCCGAGYDRNYELTGHGVLKNALSSYRGSLKKREAPIGFIDRFVSVYEMVGGESY